MVREATLFAAIIAVGASGACGLLPERVSGDDPRLVPMFEALKRVDRAALGFTPIAPKAQLRVEWRPGRGYDAMLHVDGPTSRTIAFRRVGEGYQWIGEQEIFSGPNTYKTVDGVFHESITITYETQHISGVPLNTVDIRYSGDNPELAHPEELSLDRVRPMLERWAIGG